MPFAIYMPADGCFYKPGGTVWPDLPRTSQIILSPAVSIKLTMQSWAVPDPLAKRSHPTTPRRDAAAPAGSAVPRATSPYALVLLQPGPCPQPVCAAAGLCSARLKDSCADSQCLYGIHQERKFSSTNDG